MAVFSPTAALSPSARSPAFSYLVGGVFSQFVLWSEMDSIPGLVSVDRRPFDARTPKKDSGVSEGGKKYIIERLACGRRLIPS